MSKHKKIKHEKLLNWKRKLFENSDRLKGFNGKIQECPIYICVCCERGHCKGSTVLYKPEKYILKVENHTCLKVTYD